MKTKLLSKNIKRFSELGSTNLFAEKWLTQEKPEEGSAVVTDFQTHGLGVGKNTWESARGQNLLCSIILYPNFLEADCQFMLNKVISLAVMDCVKKFLPDGEVKVKWPNDVYVGKFKIAGILSRNTISGNTIGSSILGVGLNVNQLKFSHNIPNPVSLGLVTGRHFPVDEVLKELLDTLEYLYSMLKRGEAGQIDTLYLDNLMNYRILSNYVSGEEKFTGRITGVTKYGQLIVEVDGNVRQFDMKEIQYVF